MKGVAGNGDPFCFFVRPHPLDITLFVGARDVRPTNIEGTWEELCRELLDCHAFPFSRADKLDYAALIFGLCEGARANANVRYLSGLAADFDIGPDDNRYLSFDAMCDRLEREGLAFIAYTTTNNDAGHNKYRLLMPYARNVPVSHCRAAWLACNHKFAGSIDPGTKDPARLSFLPADWFGQGSKPLADPFNAIRVNVSGAPILSNAELDGLNRLDFAPAYVISLAAPRTAASAQGGVVRLTADEATRLACGQAPNASCWNILAGLETSPIVPRWLLERLPGEPGQRDYRFMLATAKRALAQRLPVDVTTLVTLAQQFSRERLHREPPHDVERQAENALAWALREAEKSAAGRPLADE